MKEKPSPNHSTRGGHRVRALCIHTTAGTWPSDRDWLCNPISGVSSHYIVQPNGEVWQLVEEAMAAWANGVLNKPNRTIPIVDEWARTPQQPALVGLPNLESVSIEVSARMGSAWTSAQRAAVATLGGDICRRHTLAAAVVIRHADLDSVNRPFCPGLALADWKALVADITEGTVDNPFWSEIGQGLKDIIRQYGDEPLGPERYTHDPDRPGQNITSYVAGRQRGYVWWHDAGRATTVSYVPPTPPG